jgi:hypothetical protein
MAPKLCSTKPLPLAWEQQNSLQEAKDNAKKKKRQPRLPLNKNLPSFTVSVKEC